MAIIDQVVTDKYAIYQGDCVEVMADLPNDAIHLSIYSPPFGGLYHYSSSERDLSNCDDYDKFFEHYAFVVSGLARITMPGRITCVHCMDVPRSNSGTDSLIDFPGDIIRLHEKHGFRFTGRRAIWKEPLAVRLRTMQKNLAHASLVADSIDCGVASADFLLTFRKTGANPVPVRHPQGMMDYAGERIMPSDLLSFRGYKGKQTENRYSHWIWRQYADCMWDDIRMNRILPYKEGRDSEDEKHVHPLQLDVIDRCVELFSNPGETVFTPFMGVGSEVYSPIILGRRGVGVELKASYYRQAAKNVEAAAAGIKYDADNLDLGLESETMG
ncbi:MAG: DNA-methyltransferase [Acidobacteriaceae bacterium]